VCEQPAGRRFYEGEAPAEPSIRSTRRLGGSLALPLSRNSGSLVTYLPESREAIQDLIPPMKQILQVVTTTGSRSEAERLAAQLVERRLAGCVQIDGPLHSTYRWQGAIESAEEWRCTVKTSADLWPAVEAAIRQEHSYDVPEILAIPVAHVGSDYEAWLREQMVSDRSASDADASQHGLP